MGDPVDLPPRDVYIPLLHDADMGANSAVPPPDKKEPSTKDEIIYGIVVTIFGAFLVAGLGGFYENNAILGSVFIIVAAVGFLALFIRLKEYRLTAIHALIAVIALLVVASASLVYLLWTKPKEVIVHNPPTAEDIAKATAPLIAERDTAIKERDTANQKLAEATRNLRAAQEDAASPQQPSPPIGAEISWAARPFVLNFFRQPNGKAISIDPSSIGILDLRATTQGSSAVQLKNGYIISGLTGERRPLRVSTRAGYLDAETYALNEVNPIPPGVQIALYAEWTPPLPVSDFFRQWGKMTIHVDYDDTFWEKTLDENKVRDIIVQDIPNADLVLPVPRVTKKE